MPVFKTITFAYRALEDRVLAAVNLGHPDAWSCWLTRRLSLALLERAGKLLVSSSPLASRAAPGYREELAAFEQDAAMAATAKGMSPTPRDALNASAPGAELAVKLTITPRKANVCASSLPATEAAQQPACSSAPISSAYCACSRPRCSGGNG